MAEHTGACRCLAGCAVGPDYGMPDIAVPDSFLPPVVQIAQKAARKPGTDLIEWWRSLRDPELNSLVSRAIESNLDLEIALTRLQEARTQELVVIGEALRQVFAKGSWGGEWHPDFAPQPGDIVVKEHWGSSSFANTDLDMLLKQHGIAKVIVIGLLANTCIETTGRFAMELGYHVTLVKDATAAFSMDRMHAAHELNGPAPSRRLAALFAALSVEITGRFTGMLALAGPELPETQPVRRELVRRVIALDPVIDEANFRRECFRAPCQPPVLQEFLLGAVLGRFFKVLVLVPACALVLAVVLVRSADGEHGLLRPLLEFAVLITSLQIGYVFGLVSHSILSVSEHYARTFHLLMPRHSPQRNQPHCVWPRHSARVHHRPGDRKPHQVRNEAQQSNSASRCGRLGLQPDTRKALLESLSEKGFPVDALGDVLGAAARAIHDRVQAPLAICSQSVLAAAALAVQAHADVQLPMGHVRPVSDFFVTVAETGARKSASDSETLAPLDLDGYALDRPASDLALHVGGEGNDPAQLLDEQVRRVSAENPMHDRQGAPDQALGA